MMYRNEAIISTLCMQFNKPDSDMMIFFEKGIPNSRLEILGEVTHI